MKNHPRTNYRLLLLCSITVMALVAALTPATAEHLQNTKARVSVNAPRPIEFASRMLEQDYGWIITYEDPPYENEADVLDVTETVRRDLDKYKPGQAPRVLVPKGGKFSFEYDVDPMTNRPTDPGVLVQQMLDAYAIAGNPGIFRLDKDTARVHIIPAAVRNKDGVMVSRQSVLDVPITIPAQKRTGAQLLEAFCTAVSTATGTHVGIGMVPINLLMQYQTEAGAKNQNARDFLSHELDRMTGHPTMTWKLLYDPGYKTYALNMDRV